MDKEREVRQQRIDDFISRLAESRSENVTSRANKEDKNTRVDKIETRRKKELGHKSRGAKQVGAKRCPSAEPLPPPPYSPPQDDIAPPSPLKHSSLPTPEALPDYHTATSTTISEERRRRMREMRERAMQRVQAKKQKEDEELRYPSV